DRKALPGPEPDVTEQKAAKGPRTPVEEIVAGVWADVLRVPRVGAQDNFFDLGGHSLLATRVVSRLRDAFRVDLPVRALFEAPTVAELATRIETAQNAERTPAAEPIRPATRAGKLQLSFVQERLWFMDKWQPDSALYNIPAAVHVAGPLDLAALEQSVQETIRRHEVLRTTFPSQQGQPAQVIGPDLSLSRPLNDLRHLSAE